MELLEDYGMELEYAPAMQPQAEHAAAMEQELPPAHNEAAAAHDQGMSLLTVLLQNWVQSPDGITVKLISRLLCISRAVTELVHDWCAGCVTQAHLRSPCRGAFWDWALGCGTELLRREELQWMQNAADELLWDQAAEGLASSYASWLRQHARLLRTMCLGLASEQEAQVAGGLFAGAGLQGLLLQDVSMDSPCQGDLLCALQGSQRLNHLSVPIFLRPRSGLVLLPPVCQQALASLTGLQSLRLVLGAGCGEVLLPAVQHLSRLTQLRLHLRAPIGDVLPPLPPMLRELCVAGTCQPPCALNGLTALTLLELQCLRTGDELPAGLQVLRIGMLYDGAPLQALLPPLPRIEVAYAALHMDMEMM